MARGHLKCPRRWRNVGEGGEAAGMGGRHPRRRAGQYLTEQPYGVVLGVLTGLPAIDSVSAART